MDSSRQGKKQNEQCTYYLEISNPKDGDIIEIDTVSLIDSSLLIYEGSIALLKGFYTLIESKDQMD